MEELTTDDVRKVINLIKTHTLIHGDVPIDNDILNSIEHEDIFSKFKQLYGGDCTNKVNWIRENYYDYVGGKGVKLGKVAKSKSKSKSKRKKKKKTSSDDDDTKSKSHSKSKPSPKSHKTSQCKKAEETFKRCPRGRFANPTCKDRAHRDIVRICK